MTENEFPYQKETNLANYCARSQQTNKQEAPSWCIYLISNSHTSCIIYARAECIKVAPSPRFVCVFHLWRSPKWYRENWRLLNGTWPSVKLKIRLRDEPGINHVITRWLTTSWMRDPEAHDAKHFSTGNIKLSPRVLAGKGSKDALRSHKKLDIYCSIAYFQWTLLDKQ
jgi:hypothetical protein